MKKKVLFLIHDLMGGGAEKVLVNLVNNMDKSKFDITVMSLFDVGVNKQYLSNQIRYQHCYKKLFRGNMHYMKLFSPEQLHRKYIKEEYDIEVAYLEGPCARIISGCPNKQTKLVSWIHIEQHTTKCAVASFRNIREAIKCYNTFNQIVCVSETVKQDFESVMEVNTPISVLYNINESDKIIALSKAPVKEVLFSDAEFKLIGIGKLLRNKGFDRLLRIVNNLKNQHYSVHLYILGIGELERELKKYISDNQLEDCVDLLGYHDNPYKFLAKCDLFVCASLREGFSTAATEALIVGTPVCTVNVSGMKEMLGENNEYGVVTDNTEDDLTNGIKLLIDNPELFHYYQRQAIARGKDFSKDKTVKTVEQILLED